MAAKQTTKRRDRTAAILFASGLFLATGYTFGAGETKVTATPAEPAPVERSSPAPAPAPVSEAPVAQVHAAPAPAAARAESPQPSPTVQQPREVVRKQPEPPVDPRPTHLVNVPEQTPTATPQSQAANTTAHEHHHDHDRNEVISPGYDDGQLYYGDSTWPFIGWDDSGDFYNSNNNATAAAPSADYVPDNTTAPPAVAAVAAPAVAPTQTPAGAKAQLANAVDKSPALQQANSRVQMAQGVYNTERERILAELATTPDYKQAVARRRAAAHDVHAARTDDKGSTAVLDAASAKLDAGDEVTKMEERAVASDPTAAAAKARLEQAVIDRDALRSQLMSPAGNH